MQASPDNLQFAPTQPSGTIRSLLMALAVHVLLIAALTWGVSWKRESEDIAVQAELWTGVPGPATARAATPAPPVPQPPPPPAEPVVPPPPPPPPPPTPSTAAPPAATPSC